MEHSKYIIQVQSMKYNMTWEEILEEYPLQKRAVQAAVQGDVNALKKAYDDGAVMEIFTVMAAAIGGEVECLKFIHESCSMPLIDDESNETSFNTNVCDYVSNIECLQYVRKHGVPWSNYTICHFIRHGLTDCLYYAASHGCPYSAFDIIYLPDEIKNKFWLARIRWFKARIIMKYWKQYRERERKSSELHL